MENMYYEKNLFMDFKMFLYQSLNSTFPQAFWSTLIHEKYEKINLIKPDFVPIYNCISLSSNGAAYMSFVVFLGKSIPDLLCDSLLSLHSHPITTDTHIFSKKLIIYACKST